MVGNWPIGPMTYDTLIHGNCTISFDTQGFSPNFPPTPALSEVFWSPAGPSETAKHAAECHLHLGCRSFDRNSGKDPHGLGKVLRIQTKVATEKAPPIIAQMEVKTYDQGLT